MQVLICTVVFYIFFLEYTVLHNGIIHFGKIDKTANFTKHIFRELRVYDNLIFSGFSRNVFVKMDLFDCNYVRPLNFFSLFKVRRHVIGCINHDKIIGRCSEQLMRLYYYIHPGYGNKVVGLTWGSNKSPSDQEP